jgi:hypothetical protein
VSGKKSSRHCAPHTTVRARTRPAAIHPSTSAGVNGIPKAAKLSEQEPSGWSSMSEMQDRGDSSSMTGRPNSRRGRRRAWVAPRVTITAATPAAAAACPAKIGAPPIRSTLSPPGKLTRSMTLWPTTVIVARVSPMPPTLFTRPRRTRARPEPSRLPFAPLAQEAEELHALPQSPTHDNGVAKHGAEHRHHLPGRK